MFHFHLFHDLRLRLIYILIEPLNLYGSVLTEKLREERRHARQSVGLDVYLLRVVLKGEDHLPDGSLFDQSSLPAQD